MNACASHLIAGDDGKRFISHYIRPITEQIRDTDVRFAGVVACASILNLIYLLFSKPSGSSGRIRQLFSLWLDAKETELRKRANKDKT